MLVSRHIELLRFFADMSLSQSVSFCLRFFFLPTVRRVPPSLTTDTPEHTYQPPRPFHHAVTLMPLLATLLLTPLVC